MATLRLKNISKRYTPTSEPVIEALDVAIADGELIVIVGPSGCGKSTLLRLIAGLETLSGGEIIVNDQVINKVQPKARNIAMVFQNYALYPHMTVYQNMAYGLRMHGYAKADARERVEKTARTLQIDHLLLRKPGELSGGQRQRVAMGRAIVRQPDIFLFDEPLSNLDASLRVKMRLEIKRLQRELKTTSVYVTHDQVEAMTLADRLIVLNHGHVEQIGTPLDIYNSPASVFVGGFLGSPAMNFLTAQISADGRHVKLNDEWHMPLAHDKYIKYAGCDVALGIRPEHLVCEQHESEIPPFFVTIDMIESLGVNTLAYGLIPQTQQTIVASLPAKWRATVGERVAFTVKAEHLHVFDAKTGLNLETSV